MQEEVDLIMMANGRATQSIRDHKAPFEIVWNEALCDGQNQGWIVPAGCPNPAGGMKFLDMVGRAEHQAAFARALYYAPQNPKAFELLPPDIAKLMPTHPDNEKSPHGQLRMVGRQHRAGAAPLRAVGAVVSDTEIAGFFRLGSIRQNRPMIADLSAD